MTDATFEGTAEGYDAWDTVNYVSNNGEDVRFKRDTVYKKTSADSEYVAGMGAGEYSSNTAQVRLWATGDRFVGVFNKQSNPGLVGVKYNPNYAYDGYALDLIIPYFEPKAVRVIIDGDTSQTIYFGNQIMVKNGGKFDLSDGTGPVVGYALENITTSGDDVIGHIMLYPIGITSPLLGLTLVESETVTLSTTTTNTGTLAHVPKIIQSFEATSQTSTATKGKNVIISSTSPYEGEVYMNFDTGAFITSSTDAVLVAKVRYWY